MDLTPLEEEPALKKAKWVDEEPQHMPPLFLTPLVGATVQEGVKFTFECRCDRVRLPANHDEAFIDNCIHIIRLQRNVFNRPTRLL